ncbi:MAG: NAD-dependent epimerase/dehydratase family protein [Chloroflexota bacterium]|nr:NAD-dependent epimerase/dehydratase family protein [Chloroflexota bacterium]
MKYFVTGATGFIGGKLARELVKRGHTVVTIARNPGKAGDLRELGIEVHKGDITEKETLRAPMTGVDGVFHVAAWYKVGARDKTMAHDINVNGTRNVLEVMRELQIPKGVYTSTLAIYGNTHGKIADETIAPPAHFDSEYDRTKSLAHFDVAVPMMRAGLPLVIVQPGLVYGPGDTSLAGETMGQYLQGKLPMLPTVAAYAWAHVDDIVEGHILAMEKGKVGESYIICGEIARMEEAIALAERITGVRAPGMRAGAGMVSLMAGVMGVVEKVVPMPEMFASETLRSMNATYIGSNAKAKRELGYNPRSLEAGMRELLPYEMKRLGISSSPKA